MALPKIKKSEHGMLEGIKSKLGFSEPRRGRDDYDEDLEEYGEGYAEYDEYGPGYNENDFPVDEEPASRFDPYAPVTTRPARASARSGRRPAATGGPKLVSIDDVRARTQVPDSLNRDPLPARRVSSLGARRGERTMVDASRPAAANTPIALAAAASNRERSESLDSLFSSTAAEPAPVPPIAGAVGPAAASSAATTASFDPYEAYAGAGAPGHRPTRSVLVLKPASYGEVERIAKALKAGDAVVLALRNTPDNLSKRILDFSFGVSSALDASVDCAANKVFVISRGTGLTEAERTSLRNQGVL